MDTSTAVRVCCKRHRAPIRYRLTISKLFRCFHIPGVALALSADDYCQAVPCNDRRGLDVYYCVRVRIQSISLTAELISGWSDVGGRPVIVINCSEGVICGSA